MVIYKWFDNDFHHHRTQWVCISTPDFVISLFAQHSSTVTVTRCSNNASRSSSSTRVIHQAHRVAVWQRVIQQRVQQGEFNIESDKIIRNIERIKDAHRHHRRLWQQKLIKTDSHQEQVAQQRVHHQHCVHWHCHHLGHRPTVAAWMVFQQSGATSMVNGWRLCD